MGKRFAVQGGSSSMLVFDKRFGKIISQAQLFRMSSDYELFYIVTKDQASEQIEKAKEFIEMIKNYLEKRLERSFKLPKIEDVESVEP